jgi:hypothetical protein
MFPSPFSSRAQLKCFLSMHHPSSIDVLVGVDWGHGVGNVEHVEGVQKLHIKRCLHLHQCYSFKKLKICIF